jgi:uncharacterized membrane protein
MLPMPYDFNGPRLIALALIFVMWMLYGPIMTLLGRGTLNAQLHVVRLRWMRMSLDSHRENRVFDAILLGHLSASMSFFGSATLIVLASLLGALAGIGGVHAALTRLEFFPAISLGLFTTYFAALTLIIAISFFSFTYAIRKLGYTLAMIGGLNEARLANAHSQSMIAQTAVVLTESVKSLNNGIRGYYFAIAALFLFIGPYHAMVMTLLIAGVLLYRQGFSTEALAIEAYVTAMNEYEVEREQRGESVI